MKLKFLAIILVAALVITTLLAGCGNSNEAASSPVTPPSSEHSDVSEDVVDETSESENNVIAPPPSDEGGVPGTNNEETKSFVRDGKIYINEIIFYEQCGLSENHAWANRSGVTKQAAKELINYRSSDEVQDWNISGAMDDAFYLVETSSIENLKNGDVVTWTYEIDEDRLERLKGYLKDIEIVIEDGSVTIEGLEPDVMEIDVFGSWDYISLDCYYDDNGNRIWYASIKDRRENGSGYSEIEIEFDEEGKTSWEVGDDLKIKITSSPEVLEEYGYILPTYEGYVKVQYNVD